MFNKVELQKTIINDYSLLTNSLKIKNNKKNNLIQNYIVISNLKDRSIEDWKKMNNILEFELKKEKRKKWKLLAIGIGAAVIFKSL